MERTRTLCVVALAVIAAACGTNGSITDTAPRVATSTTSTATTDPAAITTPASRTTTVPATPTAAPSFQTEILEIDEGIAARMTFSWHEGCPVQLDQLRLLRLSFHDFDENVQTGELVVNADVADAVVGVFSKLFDVGFPIERMDLIDVFQGDDEASMQADNTSGFNCRRVAGTTTWSEHAYGHAIDINPLLNPWVQETAIDPPEAAPYADRTRRVAGMIHDGDAVVDAFAGIGWTWGGTWSSSKDYQHFSSTGR